MSRVLVTPRSLTSDPPAELERLRAAGYDVVLGPAGRLPTEEQLVQLLPDCVGYLAGVEPITRSVLDAAPELRVISRNGVGVDNVDLAAARARGIEVLRAEHANSRAVAELTIALILCLLRGVAPAARGMREGRWTREVGRESAGRTLGVVGSGAIGRAVLTLAGRLGMSLVACDPAPPGDLLAAGEPRFITLEQLLGAADVVTLHCPPPPGGPLLGAAELATLRAGALLVNTARAGLVAEDPLICALDDGRLAGYAVDVFHEEPPRDSRLVAHPRVVATPHIGGYTRESVAASTARAVENLLDVLGDANVRGRTPRPGRAAPPPGPRDPRPHGAIGDG